MVFPGAFSRQSCYAGCFADRSLGTNRRYIGYQSCAGEGQYDTYFLKIDNCKFKQMVKPGDTMILKMELISPIRRGICEMKGTVYVGGKICTEADLVAQIVKR